MEGAGAHGHDDAELSPLQRRRRVSDKSDIAEIDLLASDLDNEYSLTPKSEATPSFAVPLTQKQLFALSVYWFGWAMLWMPLLVVIIPKQIIDISGPESKGSNLSSILMLGSIISVICLPLFGTLSDQSQHSMGRRRPFMISGLAIGSISLLFMAADPPMPIYTSIFLCLSVSNNMIIAPYSALVPDIVPAAQRGIASSWLGGMSMIGYLSGGFVAFFLSKLGTFLTLSLLNLFHAATMYYTVRHTPEIPYKPPHNISRHGFLAALFSIIKPLYRHDFLFLFISRFLTQLGIATVQEFLAFFVADALQQPYVFNGWVVASSPSEAVSILFLPMLIGALVSSCLSGVVSDLMGGRRKIIVYVSGFLMALACLALTIARSYTAAAIISVVFGFGYGAFTAVDWALVTDLLEDKKEFAKDMAVWGIALVLPNLVMPIVGSLLDALQEAIPNSSIGYSFVFLIAAAEFTLGCFFVKYINKIK